MTPADLIRATLAGERTERSPRSFWTHFPGVDLDPVALVDATLRFAQATGIDLIKSMPNGYYCVEDWGVEADYSDIVRGGVARVVRTPIENAGDWDRIRALDIHAGALGRELSHLEQLVRSVGPDTPVLATVFSPLTIAKKLCPDGFETGLRQQRPRVERALGEIAATVRAFADTAIRAGCAGVFFAIQDATSNVGAQTYAELGRPFDLHALEGARAGWCNAIHLHGDDVLFDAVSDYPVHVLNWHIGETEPSIAAYRRSGGRKAVLGGLQRTGLTRGDVNAVQRDIEFARQADQGRGVIFGPGCVIRHPCNTDFLAQVGQMLNA